MLGTLTLKLIYRASSEALYSETETILQSTYLYVCGGNESGRRISREWSVWGLVDFQSLIFFIRFSSISL